MVKHIGEDRAALVVFVWVFVGIEVQGGPVDLVPSLVELLDGEDGLVAGDVPGLEGLDAHWLACLVESRAHPPLGQTSRPVGLPLEGDALDDVTWRDDSIGHLLDGAVGAGPVQTDKALAQSSRDQVALLHLRPDGWRDDGVEVLHALGADDGRLVVGHSELREHHAEGVLGEVRVEG